MGSPSARRNRDTFVCSTLRAVPHGLVGPQILDQPVGANHHAGLDGETNKHFGRLATPDGGALTVAVHLDDIEH